MTWCPEKLACALIEDTDQPVQLRRLIRVFNGRSVGSQGSNVSSGVNLRLYQTVGMHAHSDFNHLCTHMPTGTLCWEPGLIMTTRSQTVSDATAVYCLQNNLLKRLVTDFV